MSDSEKVTIEVVSDFKYAYRGCDVVEYTRGSTVAVAKEVAELALREKWVKLPTPEKKSGKAKEKQEPGVSGSDSEPAVAPAVSPAADAPPEAAAEGGETAGA